jgi:hypothetical protein
VSRPSFGILYAVNVFHIDDDEDDDIVSDTNKGFKGSRSMKNAGTRGTRHSRISGLFYMLMIQYPC